MRIFQDFLYSPGSRLPDQDRTSKDNSTGAIKMSSCPFPRSVIAFDHRSPEHVTLAVETYRQLRDETPVGWSENYGGYWVVTRYDDLMELSRHPEWFSSS